MITSAQNERVKYVRSLARRRVRQREGRFVVEGTRLLDELVGAGIEPALVFCTAAWAESPAGQRLLPQIHTGEGIWPVTDAVMAACADTQTPQGVLAVVPFLSLSPRPGLLLILDAIRDPGNLGTILRSAESAGVGQVLLAPGTVDLYNPKVVRGAMGAHFRLPAFSHDWPEIARQAGGRAVWLADAAGETAYDAVDWTRPSALLVGAEASGAGEEAAQMATSRVSIPMIGGAESLNAAMATTVILFEAARQRRISALKETS
ncbi:MAG: TrmH family RNA methyltransferase [Anaerolineae bacterium]|jgi:TrmH family RNA methyltransferase